MAKTYNRKNTIAGILYMQPISASRMTETPLTHLKLFQQSCGSYLSPRRIVLATTMWKQVNQAKAKAREDQIRKEYWKTMSEMGSPVVRFEDSGESAWRVVAELLGDTG
ncbi:hypothetical protein BDZ94DRAFT_29264 [Collybia nuda]|uniref:Uncharacterized protein n=1 Tax=Collybia nuda TaxID=64659 RepID=A0A9P5YJL7_9AGAR|nr:hypothetical protein BDZ94DRAFT_29264 [Collybia nuda]